MGKCLRPIKQVRVVAIVIRTNKDNGSPQRLEVDLFIYRAKFPSRRMVLRYAAGRTFFGRTRIHADCHVSRRGRRMLASGDSCEVMGVDRSSMRYCSRRACELCGSAFGNSPPSTSCQLPSIASASGSRGPSYEPRALLTALPQGEAAGTPAQRAQQAWGYGHHYSCRAVLTSAGRWISCQSRRDSFECSVDRNSGSSAHPRLRERLDRFCKHRAAKRAQQRGCNRS